MTVDLNPPWLLDRSLPGDAARLATLRESSRVWLEVDTIDMQMRELVSARARTDDLSDADYCAAAAALLAGAPLSDYGRWIYFPWSGHLAHLLPPDEFRELRLDRNRHKVTDDEADELARLRVGILGLSVGNAIGITLAMEGSFAELRLADFDRLGLSNMNRVRASVSDIGTDKTTLTARQIWEIDPYAQLSVLPEGATRENIDEFLHGLDVVIDECDSLEIKFLVRERARARGIPVLMATSDRGLLDVERFDLEPDRPIFHGLADALTAEGIREGAGSNGLTREQKVPIVIQLLEAAGMSTRLAVSLLETGKTVSTWPQLCGDVLLGAASTAHAIRALAAGKPMPSGRRTVDLDAITPILHRPESTTPTSPQRGLAHPDRVDDAPELARYLVSQAIRAPSGGNAQPWHFHWYDDVLSIALDRVRARTCLDGRNNAALLALGAATENVTIAAAARGLQAHVRTFPAGDVVAEIRFTEGADECLAMLLPLIAQRHTNRRTGTGQPLRTTTVQALTTAATCHGSNLQIIADRNRRDELAGILAAGDRIRFLCPATHGELFAELRLTGDSATRTRDGITLESLHLDAAAEAAIQLIARHDVRDMLRDHHLGTRLEDATRDAIVASSAVAVLTIPADTPTDWFAGGRSLQRLWLEATRLGLAVQPVTATLFMFKLAVDQPSAFRSQEIAELAELEQRLHNLIRPRGTPALIARLTHADPESVASLRLPPEWVLSTPHPVRP